MSLALGNAIPANNVFPADVWGIIVKNLEFWDQVAVSRTCRLFRSIVMSQDFTFNAIHNQLLSETALLAENKTINFRRCSRIDVNRQETWRQYIRRICKLPRELGNDLAALKVIPETDCQQTERVIKAVQAHLQQRQALQNYPNNAFTVGQVFVRNQAIIIRPFNADIGQQTRKDFPFPPDSVTDNTSILTRCTTLVSRIRASLWGD